MLEIFNLCCFTKNSPVTFKTRSMSFMVRHVKDLYYITWAVNMKTVYAFQIDLENLLKCTSFLFIEEDFSCLKCL